MVIKRKEALSLIAVLNNIKTKKFDIHLQYRIIKLQKAIKEEQDIYEEQMELNCSQYFEKDEKGNLITNPDGGIKIKSGQQLQCQQTIAALNNCMVQLPDIYFTLEELQELDLSLGDLEPFEPFIKI